MEQALAGVSSVGLEVAMLLEPEASLALEVAGAATNLPEVAVEGA